MERAFSAENGFVLDYLLAAYPVWSAISAFAEDRIAALEDRAKAHYASTDHSTVALDHRIKVACSMAPPGQR